MEPSEAAGIVRWVLEQYPEIDRDGVMQHCRRFLNLSRYPVYHPPGPSVPAPRPTPPPEATKGEEARWSG